MLRVFDWTDVADHELSGVTVGASFPRTMDFGKHKKKAGFAPAFDLFYQPL
jgi:hypothetical protein